MKSKIEKLESRIEKLKKELVKEKQSQKVVCGSCRKHHEMGNLVLVISQFYVQPSGCMDGDYWTTGEYPDYYLYCPSCKAYNRYYYSHGFGDNRNYMYLHQNKYNFKKIMYQADQEDNVMISMVQSAIRGDLRDPDLDDGF